MGVVYVIFFIYDCFFMSTPMIILASIPMVITWFIWIIEYLESIWG